MQWLPASSSPLGLYIKGGGRSSSQAVKSGLSVDLVNTVFESVPLGGHFTHSSIQEKEGREGEERSSDRHQRGWRGVKHAGGVLRAQSPVTILILSVGEENDSPLFCSPCLYLPLILLFLFTLHMIADSKSRAELFSVFFWVMFFITHK